MQVIVNGKNLDVSVGATVAQLLEQLELESRYVAVERNRELVPRAEHGACVLQEADAIEIVTLVGGG